MKGFAGLIVLKQRHKVTDTLFVFLPYPDLENTLQERRNGKKIKF